MIFGHLMRWSCGVYFSACLHGGLHWQIFICWTIPVSVGWSQFDHGGWWFWCALGFDLLVFYLVFLHQCSRVRLVCNSLSNVFLWFGYQDNCSLIKKSLGMFLLFLLCGIILGVLVLVLSKSCRILSWNHLVLVFFFFVWETFDDCFYFFSSYRSV